MLDFSFEHILFTVVVAIIVIGPKDLPRALRTAGRWIGKMRSISGHFRSGIETMIREAELEEMEAKWKEQTGEPFQGEIHFGPPPPNFGPRPHDRSPME